MTRLHPFPSAQELQEEYQTYREKSLAAMMLECERRLARATPTEAARNRDVPSNYDHSRDRS